jgi:lysylphosphatidylglycerol synthetase-like protein (DUF2156 family)
MVIITMSSISSSSPHYETVGSASSEVLVTHPNRDKPVVQGTRATVILLLLVSAALVLIVTIGGWQVLEGAWIIQALYIVIYLVLAFFAARWNRGVLPVAAALAVLLLVFALVAGPGWFARNHTGFTQPTLNAGLLGVITLLLVPVQMLLIAFAMRGFSQGWNVELERPATGSGGAGNTPGAAGRTYAGAQAHPA